MPKATSTKPTKGSQNQSSPKIESDPPISTITDPQEKAQSNKKKVYTKMRSDQEKVNKKDSKQPINPISVDKASQKLDSKSPTKLSIDNKLVRVYKCLCRF